MSKVVCFRLFFAELLQAQTLCVHSPEKRLGRYKYCADNSN